MFVVYILYSKSLDRFYTGSTNNLDRRVAEHNRKKGKYTDRGIPWSVVYTEYYNSVEEAKNREAYIKSKKSKKFISRLINSR
ncbi:MAG: GIY-YIG nuclease family protein [Bacteroidales bacterium]